MEVEHKIHASFLYLLAERSDIVEVLANTFVLVLGRSISWIDKEAHTCSVPLVVFRNLKQCTGFAVSVNVFCSCLFVGREKRYVATKQTCLGLGCRE